MDAPPHLNWSSTYDLLPPASLASKLPPGDKIILPQSALEQLLAASSSAQSHDADHTSPYSSILYGPGFAGHDTQQLPHPLMFRLLNPGNGKAVYAGIREFSAPEGTLGLSPFLSESLGINVHEEASDADPGVDFGPADAASAQPTRIVVIAQQLPKGTYARLRPLEAGYNPDDWRSLLERHLRENLTCVTKDAVLCVPGVRGETFKFWVDKIAPAGDGICVVDTDLEVDIEALNEEQARETMRQIISKEQATTTNGSSEGGELIFQKAVQGRVLPGAYVDYHLQSWDRSRPLIVTLSGIAGDDSLDLFITPKSSRQRALPRDSVHILGNFGPADHGVKSITLGTMDAAPDDVESILISVHAYRPPGAPQRPSEPVTYELQVQASDPGHTGGTTDGHQSHSEDEEQCANCLRWVPRRTMILHQNFCRRNNVVCPRCQAVFAKGSPEWEAHWHCDDDGAHGNSPAGKAKHDEVFHQYHQCPLCEFSTGSLPDLARHRTSVCPGKVILCRFCHLEVPQGGDPFNPSPEVVLTGMTTHELQDGARTTECHLCDKIVRLRDMETHLKHHELDKVRRSKPFICRNANCGRTLGGVGPRGQIGAATTHGQDSSNDMGLCTLCFGPLYVSLHDPDGKALRRRIERRYLGQLMSGCGKPHCGNAWCKTGRANSDLEARGSSAQAALPLVKPLVESVPKRDEPMFFCADEAGQKQRTLADVVAAEKGWDLEWCVAAAEAEKGNVNKMREWLQAWAPRR